MTQQQYMKKLTYHTLLDSMHLVNDVLHANI
jgi:hypothetical protein